ncbi:MAG: AAA family ATPase [Patescibacteria group bacterium]
MENEQKILAIVGMPGAGKSSAAEFFKNQGIPILRFGDQTDIGLKEHGLERTEKNERWYREKIRQELGMAAMAIKIEPRVRDALTSHHIVVLDGLYSWEEYIYLIGKFPQLKLLCIYASPEIRYERLRTREVRPLASDEARIRDFAELENLNKGGPIAIADRLVLNEGDKDSLENSLKIFLAEL